MGDKPYFGGITIFPYKKRDKVPPCCSHRNVRERERERERRQDKTRRESLVHEKKRE
jgi:hypothetical protein